MATRFTLEHELPTDPETFWSTFFDRAYNLALYLEELQFPAFEIVEQRETPAGLHREVKATPKTELPAAVAKLIGPNLRYSEAGDFDRDKGTFVWVMKTSALTDKMKNGGTLRVEPRGPGKLLRVVEAYSEASVFGLGGLLESSTEKQVRDGWEKSAAFMRRWLTR
ncbi:MAG: DUF2505 domain-containing protein [Polyangiaceae bacterium]|nr:DUF2505 domain-containing protein [Polyangiaceae bacterium]